MSTGNRSTQTTDAAGKMNDRTEEPVISLKTWILVFGAVLGAFMAVLDIQITNSSLRDIQGALAASLDEGTWISTAYLIAEIVVIPLTAWLTKVFSLRRYLFANAALFIMFSILCGSAQDLNQMIIARALQGITGGTLIPLAMAVILTTLPKSKQPMGLALFSITATFAPTIGPSLGGWLTDMYGWRYIFYINIIPGLLLLAAVWFAAPKQPMNLELLKSGDWFGVLTMAIGLGSLEYFLEEGNRKDWLGSSEICQALALAAVFLSIFLFLQLKGKKPLLNLSLFKQRTFSSAAVINVILGIGLYGSVYLMPAYLAQVQGYSAFQIGQVMLWFGLPQLALIPLVPKLMRTFDVRILVTTGIILFGTSCLMNSLMTHDTAGPQIIISQLIRALGQPLIFVPLSSVAMSGVQAEQAGSASSLFNMMRNLGGSVGIAAIATLLSKREQFHSSNLSIAVSSFSQSVQTRLSELAEMFQAHGADPVLAHTQALSMIDQLMRREAFILAYADSFRFLGILLLLSTLAIIFMGKVRASNAGSAH